MNNIMLDIETLGNGSNAAIKAIGAVRFDQEITAEFYQVIDLRSCIDCKFDLDASTIEWWMKQDDDARELFQTPGIHIIKALLKFRDWIGDDAIVWGNGSDFDNVILANAYRRVQINQPWKYSNNRCYRTMKNEYPEVPLNFEGVKHNAADDARSQALHLIDIWKVKRGP